MVFPEWHFNRNLQIQFNKEIKGYCKDKADAFFFSEGVNSPTNYTPTHWPPPPRSSLRLPSALRAFDARRGTEQVRCLFLLQTKWGSPSSASSLLSEISGPPIAELWSFFQAYAPRIYSNPSNSLKNGSVFKDKLAGAVTDRLWNLVVIHTLRKDRSFDFGSSFHRIVSQAVI